MWPVDVEKEKKKKENPLVNYYATYKLKICFLFPPPKRGCHIFKSLRSLIYRLLSQALYLEQRSIL